MKETKIKGLKILLDDDYIHIFNSFQINNKEKMKCIIEEAESKMEFCILHRDIKSITREWAGRNRLYRLKICKNKMKDFEKWMNIAVRYSRKIMQKDSYSI